MIVTEEVKTWYGTYQLSLWINRTYLYKFEFKSEIDVNAIKYNISLRRFGRAMNLAKGLHLPYDSTTERSLN